MVIGNIYGKIKMKRISCNQLLNESTSLNYTLAGDVVCGKWAFFTILGKYEEILDYPSHD